MNESQPIRLRIYADPHHAELDAALLRSHGVDCSVTGDHISSTLSWYGLAVAKVELWISSAEAETAIQLLEQHSAEPFSGQRPDWRGVPEPDWVCPSCDEANANSFDECWNCGQPRPENPERRPAEVEPAFVTRAEVKETDASDDESPYRSPALIRSDVRLASGHELVRRALRASILSLAFPPLSIYGLYLIRRCFQDGPPPLRIYVALWIALLTLAMTAVYAFLMVGQLRTL